MNGEVLIDIMTVEGLACALKTRRPLIGETRLLQVETGVFCHIAYCSQLVVVTHLKTVMQHFCCIIGCGNKADKDLSSLSN